MKSPNAKSLFPSNTTTEVILKNINDRKDIIKHKFKRNKYGKLGVKNLSIK